MSSNGQHQQDAELAQAGAGAEYRASMGGTTYEAGFASGGPPSHDGQSRHGTHAEADGGQAG